MTDLLSAISLSNLFLGSVLVVGTVFGGGLTVGSDAVFVGAYVVALLLALATVAGPETDAGARIGTALGSNDLLAFGLLLAIVFAGFALLDAVPSVMSGAAFLYGGAVICLEVGSWVYRVVSVR